MSDQSIASAYPSLPNERTSSPARRISLYLDLAKARLCALVLVTTAVGYFLAANLEFQSFRFLTTLLGTGCAAFGANAWNQWIESRRDARMHRTEQRPLPSQRLTSAEAFVFALSTSVAGPLILLVVGVLPALLAVLTILIYVGCYTPLKPLTPLNTLVGAVVGAIPPMIGWAAVTGGLETGAWLLGAILFAWQMPHFLALAWLYRDDYARGGFRMLPNVDREGHLTGLIAVLYSLALLPLGLSITLVGLTGWAYGIGSLVLGAWLVIAGVMLQMHRSAEAAKRLFLASVIYLPLLLGLMVLDPMLNRPDISIPPAIASITP